MNKIDITKSWQELSEEENVQILGVWVFKILLLCVSNFFKSLQTIKILYILNCRSR